METTYNDKHVRQILEPCGVLNKYLTLDYRGVWPAIKRDPLLLPEADFLRWQPADELQDLPGAPEPEDTPMLPLPFTAHQLAAFMLEGVGALVADFYGDWSDGPDPECLNEIDPKSFARRAVVEAFAAYRLAQEQVGEPDNFDANDLFMRDGFDVLAALLEAASNPPKPEPKVHPLALFVDIDGTAKPPRWVIPGFVGHGVTVIAGAHGVGKTTALLPLAMTAAGLHGDDLMPRQWRHVVYVTEDVEQAKRILAGIVQFGGMGIDAAQVRERLHVVEAKRLDVAFVAEVGKVYREQFMRQVGDVAVLPLVVFDTKSAVLAMDEENSNTEGSRIVSTLKQGFEGLPVWLVGHIAKANMGRSDAAAMSLSGAGSFEGDGNQVLYLVQEGEARYLVRGKTRFEALWAELEITSHTASTVAADEFGNMENVMLRWAVCAPPTESRKEAANRAAEQRQQEDAAKLRDDVRNAVQVAWSTGHPLSKSLVRGKVKAKQNVVVACIESLLAEGWLYEVDVPVKQRTNPTRSRFLVNLTTPEHEAYIETGIVPSAKTEIPQSWLKPPKDEIPSVPEAAIESTTKEAFNEAL